MKLPHEMISTAPDMQLYYMIAESSIEQFKTLAIKATVLEEKLNFILQKCSNRQDPPFEYYEVHIELDPIHDKLRQCCIESAVFTLLYFETFIYDYASQHLNSSYLIENYPRMSFLARWALIPKLVTGNELTNNHHGYKALIAVYDDKKYLTQVKKDEIKLGKNIISKDLKSKDINSTMIVRNCHIALTELPIEIENLDVKDRSKKRVSI